MQSVFIMASTSILKYTQTFVSCGYRYARKDWSRTKNIEVYGDDHSDDGMGCNLRIVACGTKDFQASLSDLSKVWDHQFLNDLHGLSTIVPTMEALAAYGFTFMAAPELESIKVQAGENLWAEFSRHGKASVTRVYRLNCLHRHHNPNLSEEENRQLYGKCSKIHGHEYHLEVCVTGHIHSETHLVVPRQWMDSWVSHLVIEPLNKTFLNDSIGNTSGEIIAQRFYDILTPRLLKGLELSLCLRETRKNSFIITG